TPQPPRTAKVAVLYTSAPTVVADIGRAMAMADFTSALDKTAPTALKVNISWQHWYPACSSTPWQIEGVAKALRDAGFNDILAAHNGTVVVDSHEGELRNKHKAVQDRFEIPSIHLTDDGVPWVRYAPKAEMMGFDPLSLKFIRLAHERGLGVGDPREIEVVGLDVSNINFGFRGDEDTFASWGQKLIYWGPLHFMEKPLLRTPIVPWSYAASNVYYNLLWYPLVGRARVKAAKQTEWGKLFATY